jgi:hypothetical protein
MKKTKAKPRCFLRILEDALKNIGEKRFFKDERGYQGELLQELGRRLEPGNLPGDPIIEQEYQKRLPDHGIRIRPDIIVHVPFERDLVDGRDEGNFIAIELKRRASVKRATAAFANLALMKKKLKYPLTIFVNIDSENTFASLCPKTIVGQTVCFAVRLSNDKPVVKMEKCA